MARRLLSLASILADAQPAAQWIRSTATVCRPSKEPPENKRRLKSRILQEILAARRISTRNNRMLDLFFLDVGFTFGRPPYSRLKGQSDAEWSRAEDEKLLNKMHSVGRSDWNKVAGYVGKSEGDCRKRYSSLLQTNQTRGYRDMDSVAVRLHTAIKKAREERKQAKMEKKLKKTSFEKENGKGRNAEKNTKKVSLPRDSRRRKDRNML